MKYHWVTALFIIFCGSVHGLATEAKNSLVKIDFKYSKFPLKIETFEVEPLAQFNISQTGLVKDLKDAPVAGPLDPKIKVEIPGQKSFVLVVRNTTKKDLYFFASPHVLHPQEHSLGHYFECLCIHHVFRVPANRIWFRIVRLNLDQAGRTAPSAITHTIIGLTTAQVKKEYSKQLYDYGSGANSESDEE